MRAFLDAILAAIGAASLTTVEYDSVDWGIVEEYSQDIYDGLKGILEARDNVSTHVKRLKGYFEAQGAEISDNPPTPHSNIYLGGDLDRDITNVSAIQQLDTSNIDPKSHVYFGGAVDSAPSIIVVGQEVIIELSGTVTYADAPFTGDVDEGYLLVSEASTTLRETGLYYNSSSTPYLRLEDNVVLKFGTGGDATFYYDGTNFLVNPKAVGTGVMLMNDTSKLCLGRTGFQIHGSASGQYLNIYNTVNSGVIDINPSGTNGQISLSSGNGSTSVYGGFNVFGTTMEIDADWTAFRSSENLISLSDDLNPNEWFHVSTDPSGSTYPAGIYTKAFYFLQAYSETPGTTVTIDFSIDRASVRRWTAGQNETVSFTGGGSAVVDGQIMICEITNDATSARTITFDSNFQVSGTIVGTISKTSVITFMYNGGASKWREQNRILGVA